MTRAERRRSSELHRLDKVVLRFPEGARPSVETVFHKGSEDFPEENVLCFDIGVPDSHEEEMPVEHFIVPISRFEVYVSLPK